MSDTVVACVVEPVPVRVMVLVPAGVLVAVVTDMVDDPPLVTDVGLNVAAAPEGRPEALRVTVCGVPAVVAVDTGHEAPAPRLTDWLPRGGQNEKEMVRGVGPQ